MPQRTGIAQAFRRFSTVMAVPDIMRASVPFREEARIEGSTPL
jgi:hypothetical protein